MQNALKTHLKSHFPELKSERSILAVSGGRDSMALAHLLKALDYTIVLAHCNFRLRGKASDEDAEFVKKWSEKCGLTCFIQDFDTEAFAKAENLSIQMAARQLRYHWFEELRKEQGYDNILTAHHADDTAETFLINLSRGTGIDGLTGIPERNGKIVRPLLPFSRKQIDEYIKKNDIQWREDCSNDSDKYLRNHLRHHAIPALDAAAPQFMDGLSKTMKNLKASSALAKDYMAVVYANVVTQSFEGYQLNINELNKLPHTREVLYELLKDFNFNAWDDVYDLLDAQAGKKILSHTHRLIKDRGVLLLTENRQHLPGENAEIPNEYQLDQHDKQINGDGFVLTQKAVSHFEIQNQNEAVFAAKDLNYPLVIRKWRVGDYFYPFGMQGKKKLSKYFKDEKFSALAKENTWLLCNGGHIIWIMGRRTDERYRIRGKADGLIKFTFENE